MTPYYRYHVFFCTNQRDDGSACCADHRSQDMRDYAKARIKELGLSGRGNVRVNSAGCLDRCEEGPVIVVYPSTLRARGTRMSIARTSMRSSTSTWYRAGSSIG